VQSHVDWWESILALLLVSGINLVLLLPLLLLFFFQPLYRARLLAFLNLPQPDPSGGATASLIIAEQAPPLAASQGGGN
jgi:hypothetical protein